MSRFLRSVTVLFAAAAVTLAGDETSAQPVGGYAGSFLRRPMIAQEIGLGGLFSSFSPDASAVFSNSASLASLTHPSFSASASTASFGLVRSAVFGFGMPIGRYGGFGIGVTTFGIGEHNAYNRNFNRIGTVANPHTAISVGAGLPIGPASIGATVSYLRQDYTGQSGGDNGYAVDLSATMTFEDRLYLAFSLNDVAGEIVAPGGGVRDALPWNARFSASYVYPFEERSELVRPDPTGRAVERHLRPPTYLLGAVETQVSEANALEMASFAVEAVPIAGIDLGFRLGANSLGDISGGFLYKFPVEFTSELRLDYAVRRDYELGELTHHVTLTAEL